MIAYIIGQHTKLKESVAVRLYAITDGSRLMQCFREHYVTEIILKNYDDGQLVMENRGLHVVYSAKASKARFY